MINCPPFNAEPPFYINHMRFYPLVNVPICAFCTYCIIFRSTPVMRAYSLRLLHIQLLSALTDIFLFLSIPVVFFPFPAGYPVGVITVLEISIHHLNLTLLVAFGLNCGSVFQLFIYHLQNVVPAHHPLKSPKKWLFMSKCLVYLIAITPALYFSRALKSAAENENMINELKLVRKSFFCEKYYCALFKIKTKH